MKIIPLTNSPNQTFRCVIPVNGENIDFKFFLSYNYEAQYWQLTLYYTKTNERIVSNIPILVSTKRFVNIFCQFGYLNIGACYILPTSSSTSVDMPNDKQLGNEYLMVWGDNK